MRHQETRAVYALWDAMKRQGRAPARTAVEPRTFARHLSQLCLLDKAGPDALIRLGGTDVCALFGRELRQETFGGLWSKGARLSVQAALARCLTLAQPTVIEALAETVDGRHIGVEIMLLPLNDERGLTSQIMAYVQPLDPVARLGGQPVAGFRFLGMSEAKPPAGGGGDGGLTKAGQPAAPGPRPHLRLVVSNAIAAAQRSLMAPARPEAALGLVQ
jgi:hypothetical protein